MKKKLVLKGGPSKKISSVRGGVTQKIPLKYCKNSIYDDAKFSTKMP